MFKKRPDIYFEFDKHCVIVEINENQHKSYDDYCECARINEIINGIGVNQLFLLDLIQTLLSIIIKLLK